MGSVAVNPRACGNILSGNVYTLFQNSIPVLEPSSGTIGNNGALSAISALTNAYTSAYLYFPANAIAAGVAAGLYYTVMSSTTAGTIYNNTYTSGVPIIPASPTPFVTTGPGAFTQTTNEITLLSLILPGHTLGPNGSMHITALMGDTTNNANSKTAKVKLDSTVIIQNTILTSGRAIRLEGIFSNRNSESINAYPASTAALCFCTTTATVSASNVHGSIDTSSDRTFSITAQLASAADSIILDSTRIVVYPG
jgi:hypothetical protein